MQRVSDMLGKVVDTYHIQEVLGKGGMGVVYRALDTSLDKVVALKVMNPLLVEDERFMRRFRSEAKALGRLHHPHIVSVFALRHIEHHLFIVMEFVEGATLADRIKQHGPMAWQDALPIIRQALDAIDYAHREKIIHRDIKPHNILLSDDGFVKVTDFGLAKIQASRSDSVVATRTGFTGGTLYYMPPEQLEGLPNVDHRGDLYGLGMTCYEMLAGRTPFDKLSSEFAILKAIDAHDIPPLDQFTPDVPEPLVRIVMKAIERYPDDRYQTAGEMLAAMEAWQAAVAAAGAEASATPLPPAPVVPSRPSRREGEVDGLLKRLNAALTQGSRWVASALQTGWGAGKKKSRSVLRTVIARTPPKAASSSSEQPAPEAATPKSAPVTPIPARKAPSRAFLRVKPHPVLAMGALVAFLLIGLLLYLGTRRPSPTAAVDEAAATSDTVSVSIRTLPVEAMVFVDGLRVGSTPLIDYALSAGTRVLHIEKPGYLPLDTSVTLELDQAHALAFSLQEKAPLPQQPAVGTLTVRTEPAGADVWLDDRNAGQTPLTMRDLKAGTHRLVLRKRGFRDNARSITVEPGKAAVIQATLKALTGLMKITVRPYGDIYVDGGLKAQRAEVPHTEQVSTGVYRVRVMHPDFGTWEKQVTIDSSDTREVFFNFNQQFAVAVTSEPDKAEILVDGKPTGTYTPGVVRLPPGQRTIALRRQAYVMEGAARVFTLERDWTDPPLHFTLRALK